MTRVYSLAILVMLGLPGHSSNPEDENVSTMVRTFEATQQPIGGGSCGEMHNFAFFDTYGEPTSYGHGAVTHHPDYEVRSSFWVEAPHPTVKSQWIPNSTHELCDDGEVN